MKLWPVLYSISSPRFAPARHQRTDLADHLLFVGMLAALGGDIQIVVEGGKMLADPFGGGFALRRGAGAFGDQLGALHLGEVELRRLGVLDRHQRAVEGVDGDAARSRQNAIARQAHDADDGAHDHEGAEDARTDGVFGDPHVRFRAFPGNEISSPDQGLGRLNRCQRTRTVSFIVG